MSLQKKSLFICLWLFFGTCLYAYTWSSHLDYFPQLPEVVGLWIAKMTGMENSDDVELLTFYYVLIVSFLAVVSLTAVGAILLQFVRKFRS